MSGLIIMEAAIKPVLTLLGAINAAVRMVTCSMKMATTLLVRHFLPITVYGSSLPKFIMYNLR